MNTIILKWDPASSPVTMERFEKELLANDWPQFKWSVWEHEQAHTGDQFFLLRVGEGNTGIVAGGSIISDAYQADDWSGKDRVVFYNDIAPDFILHPDRCPILTTARLTKAMPDFEWNGGHSGVVLPPDYAKILNEMWLALLEQIELDDMFDFERASDPMLSDEFIDWDDDGNG